MLSVTVFSGRRLVPAWLLFLAVPLAALAQGQLPGIDAKWRHFQSEHFELYSRNGEGESREFLHNLELAHAIFFEAYGFKPIRALPITVYFFSRDRHFDAYKPDAARQLENIGTFYHAEPDRGILTVAPLPSYEAARQLAFGSYTHHLFRLMGDTPPVWYGYGMAGIFSNLVIKSKTFELGRPDPHEVARLQQATLIPVEVMFGSGHDAGSFQTDRGNRLFHDQSWSFVHYLYFGAHKLPREGVSRFVNFTLQQGRKFDAEKTRQMFEQSTGITYEQMNRELQRYFRNGRYSYSEKPLPVVPAAKSYAMRAVSPAEINLRLAELALRVNRSALGKLTLLHAAEQPAEAARVQEALAADAVREGDWDQAAERWERALAAGSTNPAIMHELAVFEGRKRFSRFDLYYRLPDDAAAKLRQLLEKSIAAAPLQTDAYEILAWVEATASDPQIRNVNLVQNHFSQLKEQGRTLLALAVVRMRLGDKTGATGLLDTLGNFATDDWIKYGLEHTRAALEERPVDYSRLPVAGARAGTRGVPIPTRIVKPPM